MSINLSRLPIWIIPLILLFITGNPLPAQGQFPPDTGEEKEEVTEPEWPEDSLGRRTPRGTISGFLEAVGDQNYQKAEQYLDLKPDISNSMKGARMAQILQSLLDKRGNLMPYSWISDETTGHTDDKLPAQQDRVGTLTANDKTFTLLLENVSTTDEAPVWLVSSQTLEKLDDVQLDNDTLLIDRLLPGVLEEKTWGGVPVGHWLAIIVLVVIAYIMAWLISLLVQLIIRSVWIRARTEPTIGVIKALALPIQIFISVLIFTNISQAIGISIIVRQWFNEITALLGVAALLLLLWRLAEFLGNFIQKRMTMRGQSSAVSLILFLQRMAKVIIMVLGVIAVLSAFGINVTAGLAALGIGGIAIALGAQKAIENFVGSVTLITDQPIRVGDFCKSGDTVGTVERIGMRSTRIRTLDRTLVTIPNGEFSSSKIENYAHRDRFRFNIVLGMRYETTADQIRYLLVEIRSLLYAHPKVSPDPARIRFNGFGSTSLDLEIFAYIDTRVFDDFLEVREDLLLRIMDVVEASGTGFAFPSQTLYMARDQGISEEKTQAAEETVKNWRAKGELQLPGFDPERIRELKDSIPYPPEGSSKRTDP